MVVMSASTVMIVVMVFVVIMPASTVMIVMMMFVVVMSASAVVIVMMFMSMFCQGLIMVILEYHAYFVYDQCFLFQRRSGVDGVCNHFHDFRYTVNRGQCTHQSLHCDLSCLYRQCFQRAACFLDKISKECFLFFFCSHRQIFWQMELEQFVI